MTVDNRPTAETSTPWPMQTGLFPIASDPESGKALLEELGIIEVVIVVAENVVIVVEREVSVTGTDVVIVVRPPA